MIHTVTERPRERSRRTADEWFHTRNVQWTSGEWTISYLFSSRGSVREVWIWRTHSESDRDCHALTPEPVGVGGAVEAYELVARALREPALAGPRWGAVKADDDACCHCGYSYDEHDPFNRACPDDDAHAAANAAEW